MYTAKDKTIKYVGLGIVLSFLYLLEALVLPRFRLFGISPMVMPAAVALIALFEGPFTAASAGFAAGLVTDLMSPRFPVFHSIVFLLLGLVTGAVCRYLFKKNILSGYIWGILSLLFVSLTRYLIFFLIPGRAGISAIYRVCLPEVLYSLLFLPLWYLLFRGFWRKFSQEEK